MANTVALEDRAWRPPAREGAHSASARKLALASLGLLGLAFGGFPIWAARRILYPVSFEPPTEPAAAQLEIDVPVTAERVEFSGRSGDLLSGWFVPGPAASPERYPTILLAHGYGGYKEQMVGYAKMLHEGGYATFMFDMRGSGLLKGRPVTLGHKERWDLLDAFNYVSSRSDVDAARIGVFGVSMGAATALLAAAEEKEIKAVVADSAYAGLADMVRPGIRTFVGPAALPFARLIVFCAETMLGLKSEDIKPDLAASRLGERPLLVIHGCNDPLVAPTSAERIYDAASGPKEVWKIPNCGHGLGPMVAYEEYHLRINDFFDRHLRSDQSSSPQQVQRPA